MRIPERPIKHCYWVDEGRLLAGEYPRELGESASRAKLQALLDAGVTLFLDLTEVGEPTPAGPLKPYAPLLSGFADPRVRSVRLPISDVSVPQTAQEMAAILDCIDDELERGGAVYVHCWGGVGRTGTVVGCWLARHGRTGSEALAQLQRLWRTNPKSAWKRHSPETEEQHRCVREWYEPRLR